MKSHTDLPQSKKLAEILPIESADMFWADGERPAIWVNKDVRLDDDDVPCWSLAVLFDIIPYAIHISDNKFYRLGIDKGYNSYAIWYEDNGCTVNTLDVTANNFVDACYEMIIKLHKQNLL